MYNYWLDSIFFDKITIKPTIINLVNFQTNFDQLIQIDRHLVSLIFF